MKEIGIEKVTLNIGIGAATDKLEKSIKLLEKITGSKAVPTTTQKRIPTWKIRPGLQIGCKVTLRGKKAQELLERLLKAINHTIKESSFDNGGNFSFGIPEYLDIPGAEYDPEIGIIGLEAAITLKRPGFRIKMKKIKRAKIPAKHRISKQEAIEYMKERFKINLIE